MLCVVYLGRLKLWIHHLRGKLRRQERTSTGAWLLLLHFQIGSVSFHWELFWGAALVYMALPGICREQRLTCHLSNSITKFYNFKASFFLPLLHAEYCQVVGCTCCRKIACTICHVFSSTRMAGGFPPARIALLCPSEWGSIRLQCISYYFCWSDLLLPTPTPLLSSSINRPQHFPFLLTQPRGGVDFGSDLPNLHSRLFLRCESSFSATILSAFCKSGCGGISLVVMVLVVGCLCRPHFLYSDG